MIDRNKLTPSRLMVGDWYKNIEFDEYRQWTANDYMETNTDYCEPIRLTEQIIEKNNLRYRRINIDYDGWEISIEPHSTWFLFSLTYTVDDAYDYSIEDMPIYYVHELQKVLRCIDLEDIANNLTV